MRTLQFDPYSKHARLEAEKCGRVILRAPTARRADRDRRVTSDNPMGKNLPLLDARGREISEGIRNQCDQNNAPPLPPPPFHRRGIYNRVCFPPLFIYPFYASCERGEAMRIIRQRGVLYAVCTVLYCITETRSLASRTFPPRGTPARGRAAVSASETLP